MRSTVLHGFIRFFYQSLPSTIVFDVLSYHLQPAYYVANFTDAARYGRLDAPLAANLFSEVGLRGVLRLVMNATLLAQSWFKDASPLSNVPFWSLCYECVYYALFGITLYLRGMARVAGWVVTFVLIGPTVFLMYPIWLLGCAAYDWYREGELTSRLLRNLCLLSLLSIAGVHGSRALLARMHWDWFYAGRLVPFMDYVAIASVATMTPLCIALRRFSFSEHQTWPKLIRKVAAATFPLYLIHVPLYVLWTAMLPSMRASVPSRLIVLLFAITLAFLLTGPCDSLKNSLRKRMMPGLPLA